MKINHKDSYTDFGEQFEVDNKIDGFHGSKEMLEDVVRPFNLKLIKNKVIMEVGSGIGRILKNLLKFNPKQITAVEPSKAINVAKKNNEESKKIIFKKIKEKILAKI